MKFASSYPTDSRTNPCYSLNKIEGTPILKLVMVKRLTDPRPLIQIWCPRSKLNMDDLSVLAGP